MYMIYICDSLPPPLLQHHSRWYKKWGLDYQMKLPPELNLPRATLHRLLAIRSSHGDFSWYHTKFNHKDAKLVCSCGQPKSPEHLVFCRKQGGFQTPANTATITTYQP